MSLVHSDPAAAAELAGRWRDAAEGSQAAAPLQCLGMAESERGEWAAAEAAFAAARDALPASDAVLRARLGALAANAALAGGSAARALAALDTALAEAANEAVLSGEIQLDRSRALVALGKLDNARAALTAARTVLADQAEVWLLSATLSRRQGRLAEAQSQIEMAAQLLPVDPEIGLEAGVIAVLGGRDDAARKSWQSVIDAAPGSEFAATARGYIGQLAKP